MVNKNYTPYGDEWKKEMEKLPKKVIIEMFSKTGFDKMYLAELADYRIQCRNYLMGVRPEDLTVEDCLEQLGYGRNGLGS